MNKKFIRILFMLVIVVSLFAALTVFASADPSGNCGANGENNRNGDSVQWELQWHNNDAMLVISGDGYMEDFAYHFYDPGRYVPWWDYHENITGITINDGVKSIGENAFRNLPNLKTLEVPGSVSSIGYCGVYDCASLEKVLLHEGVESIGEYAFMDDYALETVVLPSTLKTIDYEAFYNDDSIQTVWYYGDSLSNVSIAEYNEALTTKDVKCLDQILDFNKWYTNESCHWRENKPGVPYRFYGPEEMHYDNDGDFLCDACGHGFTDPREWHLDELYHWREPYNGGDALKFSHSDSQRDGICDICGNGILDTTKSLRYFDIDGNNKSVTSYVQYLSGKETELKSGWYAVGADLDFGDTRLKITGDVTIILKTDCSMSLTKGIDLTEGNTLTITSDTANRDSAGKLEIHATGDDTAIGSPSLKGEKYVGLNDYPPNAQGAGTLNLIHCNVVLTAENVPAFGGGKGIYVPNGDPHQVSRGGNGGNLNVYKSSLVASSVKWRAIGGGVAGDQKSFGGSVTSGYDFNYYHGKNTNIKICDTDTYIRAGSDSDNAVILSSTELNNAKYVEFVPGSVTGFTLSGGNWWIIAAGAVVILGALAAVLIVKRKKKNSL